MVGKKIDQSHKEVARTHGRIADLQIKNGIGRVELKQCRAIRLRLAGLVKKRLQPLINQRRHRALDDEFHQLIRRVIRAGALAGETVEADVDAALRRRIGHRLIFQQLFINRAKLAH